MLERLRQLFSPAPASDEHPGACLGLLKAIHAKGGGVSDIDQLLDTYSPELTVALKQRFLRWGEATVELTDRGRRVVDRWTIA
jgi:hypothetical protein